MANATLRSALGLAALTVSMAGCEMAGIRHPSAEGSWHATKFTTYTDGVPTDQLAAGSTIMLTLTGDGRTVGHLHLVATAFSPAMDVDLTGTWQSVLGDRVVLSHDSDTFLEDLQLLIETHMLWATTYVGIGSGVQLEFTHT